MKKPLFEGVATALVTPFKGSTIDYAVYDKLLDFQLSAGVDAVVVCGTTGESAALTDDEKLDLIAHTIAYAGKRCKVIAGTGSNDTAHAISLSRAASSLGSDGLLLVTPYYNKCTQDGLFAHYTAIADAVTCPCILYNVPSRTGLEMQAQTCIRLSKHPNINGLKEAGHDFAKVQQILRSCEGEFFIWSGNDDLTVPLISIGASGVISVCSNVKPREMLDMTHCALRGEILPAGKLQRQLLPLMEALFCEVNPIPVKKALEILGFSVGDPRLPLTPLSEKYYENLKEQLLHG